MCFITGRHIDLSRLSSDLGYMEWILGFGVESYGNPKFNGGIPIYPHIRVWMRKGLQEYMVLCYQCCHLGLWME